MSDHNPADEKAVACPFCGAYVLTHGSPPKVWAACSLCAASGPEIENLTEDEAIAAFTEPKHLAARIRAEASGEVAALLEDAASMIRAEVEEGAWSSSPTYEDGEGGCVCLGCGDTNGSHGAKCIAMRANALLARIDAALKGDA